MIAMSTTLPTNVSIIVTITDEIANTSRGQYTFVTRLIFPVRALTANRRADAVKFQVRRPRNAKSGYGTVTCNGATRMKMTENTAVLSSGMNTAQPNPMIACL